MTIFWRVWATSAAVILAVLVVFLALGTFQFSRVHSSLVGERLVVLANRTAAPFEAAARLGLPIADVRNARGLLERARQTEDRIEAAYVFDARGEIAHATGGGTDGLAELAKVHRRYLDAPEWYATTHSGFVAGVNFADAAGRRAGGVAVLYPGGGTATRVWAMAAELSLAGLGIFCLGAAIAGLLLRLGLRGTIAEFDGVDRDIADFERDSWRLADDGDSPTGLRADLDTAYARYREMAAEIRRLDAGSGR